MNRYGLRIWDPLLNKGAIWTYYEGAAKDDNRDEGATLVVQTPDKRGWWWNIPLHGDRLSCGIVRPFEDIFKNRGGLEQTYLEEVEQHAVHQAPRRQREADHRLLRDPRLLVSLDASWPATAGCWSATPSASSIRSTRRA